MRRAKRSLAEQQAWTLLKSARSMELATTSPEGDPILRTLNGVVVGDWVLFHGAIAGEKNQALGRPAIVAASQTITQVPSFFLDPRMACPATTYYRSVQAKGRLLEVTDPAERRKMLEALMQKLQPEGGYQSFLDGSDLYEKELRSVRVIGVRVEEITGKENLGQDHPAARTEKVVRGLWQRGSPDDLRAIELILERSPDARPSEWTWAPFQLAVFPLPAWAEQHARLLEGQYWRLGVEPERVLTSIENSRAWVGAVDPEGILVGAARAVTDEAWVGRICDVIVHPDVRQRGLGRRLLSQLLDHPALRSVPHLSLGTRDQQRLYAEFGFHEVYRDERTGTSEMRRQPGA